MAERAQWGVPRKADATLPGPSHGPARRLASPLAWAPWLLPPALCVLLAHLLQSAPPPQLPGLLGFLGAAAAAHVALRGPKAAMPWVPAAWASLAMLAPGASPWLAGAVAAQGLAAGQLVALWASGPASLATPLGVGRLAAAAGFTSILGASLAATLLPAPDARMWLDLYLGNLAGTLVLTGGALALAGPRRSPGRLAEGAGLLLATVCVVAFGYGAFGWLAPGAPVAFLCLTPVIWAALRFGSAGTAATVLALAAVALPMSRGGAGPFGAQPAEVRFALQAMFLGVASLVGFLAASLVASRDELARTLEERVAARTADLAAATGRLQAEVASRRAAEERHAASAALMAGLADASPVGIFQVDARGRIAYANQRWQEISGAVAGPDGILAPSPHPDEREALLRSWKAAKAQGLPWTAEFHLLHPDGSSRKCRVRANPLHAGGAVTGYVGVLEDITDEERARVREMEMVRLRQEADFRTDFLRTAAHELGNPLTPIRLQARVLHRVLHDGDASAQRSLDILDRNVARLNLLVRDMLESARLQSGRLAMAPRHTDMALLVHDVAETYQDQAIQAGVTLDTQGPAGLPIVADPDRIAQVLDNLLSNSLKYTPEGGTIQVRYGTCTAGCACGSATDGGGPGGPGAPIVPRVHVEVADSGAGLTQDQMARLFQPFAQVHEGAHEGSGLGLHISRGIAQQHGGSLGCHSDGEGRGATFTLVLPLQPVRT